MAQVPATASGFLSALRENVEVDVEPVPLPSVHLRAGRAGDDQDVDISDILLAIGDFGALSPAAWP